ncbi:CRISPR-associated protein Csx16 [Methylomarinum sp. Ch1-1]|uniref:CRISPR-associated protein Csx16 n=1 Tax=Methylomarinum roseum TaxID=3067653 RepID=A0AAU7NQ06_9GAMM|nr:CRISPR-associated protein Csx16 [Methylomarinum sp. Ch1-1]MDP4521012.1 CRISPR-associated protein Csx16 [Methylomarinum sp. Ch1-1]
MTTYFISRHPGAIQWAQEQGICVDKQLAHLDIDEIRSGDVVIGSLPVNLVAELTLKNARYLHLTLDLPTEWRGLELNIEQMRQCHARLEEYRVDRIEE